MSLLGVLVVQGASVPTDHGALGDIETLASILEKVATVIAFVVAGIFTYYKFFKDRIYRPRIETDISAGSITVGADRYLLCRTKLKNLGSTKLELERSGVGVTVYASRPPAEGHKFVRWDEWARGDVFPRHDWLEPAETISDDVLLRSPPNDAAAFLVVLDVTVKQPRRNITVVGRRIVPTTSEWSDDGGHDPQHDSTKEAQ